MDSLLKKIKVEACQTFFVVLYLPCYIALMIYTYVVVHFVLVPLTYLCN